MVLCWYCTGHSVSTIAQPWCWIGAGFFFWVLDGCWMFFQGAGWVLDVFSRCWIGAGYISRCWMGAGCFFGVWLVLDAFSGCWMGAGWVLDAYSGCWMLIQGAGCFSWVLDGCWMGIGCFSLFYPALLCFIQHFWCWMGAGWTIFEIRARSKQERCWMPSAGENTMIRASQKWEDDIYRGTAFQHNPQWSTSTRDGTIPWSFEKPRPVPSRPVPSRPAG